MLLTSEQRGYLTGWQLGFAYYFLLLTYCQPALEALLRAGAEVDAPDAKGVTGLMDAAQNRNLDLFRFLRKHGADPQCKDKAGRNALMYAVTPSWRIEAKSEEVPFYTAIIEDLLKSGVDINEKDQAGQTALDLAKKAKQPILAEILQKNGAK